MNSALTAVYDAVAPLLREAFGDDVTVVMKHFDHDNRVGVAVEFPNGYRNAFWVPSDAPAAALEDAARAFIRLMGAGAETFFAPKGQPKHYRMKAEVGNFS